jgi:YfaZ precursor
MKFSAGVMLGLLLCSAASANELDLSFNSNAVRFEYVQAFSQSDLQANVGLLSNSDDGWVATGSLYISGFTSDRASPLQTSIGGRTGWVNGDDSGQDGVPLALGGYLEYTFPRLSRVTLRGDAWYAPDALCAGDLDKYQDYTLRLAYSLLEQADLYVGVRYVQADFSNDSDAEFDDDAIIGINIRF